MTNSSDHHFEDGHPCEQCIVKPICGRVNGEYDGVCDLPEKYDYWKFDQAMEKVKNLKKAAAEGDLDALNEMAQLATDSLNFGKQNLMQQDEYRKAHFEMRKNMNNTFQRIEKFLKKGKK
jgi:hypothetical protein